MRSMFGTVIADRRRADLASNAVGNGARLADMAHVTAWAAAGETKRWA